MLVAITIKINVTLMTVHDVVSVTAKRGAGKHAYGKGVFVTFLL